MPIYMFENTRTGETFEVLMKYADLEQFLKDQPDVKHIIGSPKIVTNVGNLHGKVDDGFRERIAKIKETYKVNNIPDY